MEKQLYTILINILPYIDYEKVPQELVNVADALINSYENTMLKEARYGRAAI